MGASQFIALLESRGLLDPEIVSELRRQVEQSKGRLTPETIARLLVENGQLTRFQATKLVTEINESLGDKKADPSMALRGGRPLDIPEESPHDSVDDLIPADLLPAEEQVAAEIVEPVEIEVVEEVEKPKKKKKSRPMDVPAEKPKEQPYVASSLEFEDLPRRVVRAPVVKKKNAWESKRIIASAFVLLLLLIFLFPLLGWALRGSADAAFAQAEDFYKGRDYEKAAKAFEAFAKNHSGDERASQSKVFVGLSKIRDKAEKATDPSEALKACQDLLPTISGETALNELRGDVTDTLLRISEKFIERMEASNKTADRKALVEKMNQQMEFVRDPRFVGTQERSQNELRIRKIEEDQNRIQREIIRGDELANTIVAMTKAVETKDISQAYELRRNLLRKYPQLNTDPKINELLDNATKEQQATVVPANSSPVVVNDVQDKGSSTSAMLVTRRAPGVDSETGSIFYLAVKGSILAMNAGNGKVLWRHHIGRDWNGEPKRISPNNDSDVLITLSDQGILRRLAAADGNIVWEVQFKGRVIPPTIDGDDLFITTTAGEIFCLDALTGQSRWGKKLAQPIDVGVGGATSKRRRYVMGNHSNLYVLSRTSGQCEEVEYVGHNPSSIVVPPIWILNHLIIFDNDGPDYSTMRVYSTNDEGLDIKPAQNPMTLRGHVVVEPQVEGRRVTVTTNLGEVAILDVDRDNPKNRVFKLLNLIENETTPKTTWPLTVGNDLWLASSRLIYYQIQVSSQKLNRNWLKEDGDQFTGRPMKVDDYVVYSRVVRGNLGVRVAAIKPVSGDVVWETDVGVPVSAISIDAQGITAVTTQGAIFSLENKSFGRNQVTESFENLARNQRTMNFGSPTTLKDSRIAFVNQSKGNQLLIVDPSKRGPGASKMVVMDLNDSFPTGECIALGSGAVVFAMENGQVAMVDPEKGKMIGSPFQPAMQPGEKIRWLNPVALSDNQSLVIGDQRKFLYKLNTQRQLRMVTSVPLDQNLKGRLAVLGDTIAACASGGSNDSIEFFSAAELNKTGSVSLEGRVNWGPYALTAANHSCFIAMSDVEGLVVFNDGGKLSWSKALDKFVPVGKPVVVEEDFYIASTTGEIVRASLKEGGVFVRSSVGEPVYGTPIVLPKGLIIPGDEGIVVTTPIPSTDSSQTNRN